jgi:hypothetical protein
MLTFNCPKCDRFCAVVEDYAGKRVRCTHCGCRFIVPNQSGQKTVIYIDPPEPPLPHFYRVVLLENWKGLFRKESLVGLVFCIVMPCFQFFLGDLDYSFTMGRFRPPLIVGWITQIITLGGLSWYFFQTIGSTFLYPETLPEMDIGFGFEYFGNLFKSLYLFIVAVVLALMPGMVVGTILESRNLLPGWSQVILFVFSCFFLALFLALFGMEMPTWIIFRVDLLIRAILKTIRPYLVTALITIIAFGVWLASLWTFHTNKNMTTLKSVLHLSWRIVGVILMLYAMRTIGFYCRHYAHTCPWLWSKKQDSSL